MKKLIAFLSACAVITCSFASCGKEEAEESNEKSVSVSESEAETSETETETEEETTEEETETEAATEEETEEASAEEADSDVVGMWYMEDDGMMMIFNVKDDGNVDAVIDVTELTHFTADGGMFIDGDILEPEYVDYDGKNLVVAVEDEEAFNMTKDSGDAESLDGEYTLNSGIMYDSVSEGGEDIGVIINGEMLFASYRNIISYTTDNGVVSLAGLENLDYDFDTAELEYEVSGDTFTLFDPEEDGEDVILKKFDFKTYKPSVNTSTETATSGEDSENEVSEGETISDSDRTTEGSVVGMWISPDDSSYGFNFRDDNKCGILVDATEMVHFTSDGKFFMSEMSIESDGITNDGTTLSVSAMGNDILTMKRNDGSNSGSFDGSYTLVSGAFYDGMALSMCDSFGIEDGNATIYAIVSGEQMYIELANIFDYTAEDGLLTMDGLENFDIPSGSAVKYEFSGNKLIIMNEDGTGEEIFEKVELS